MLLDFSNPAHVEDVKKMSDADIGGFSTVNFDHIPATATQAAHARFHGSISIDLPTNQPDVQRTGYAAWRSKDRPPTIFGKLLWNIDPYAYLALRVKSDGRRYFVNVQTESIIPTDIHQHRLHAKRPGEWETVLIKWNDFVRTNHGAVVEPQTEMLRERVKTIGIGSIDRQVGPYDLSIEKMWATNDPDGKLDEPQTEKERQAKELETAL